MQRLRSEESQQKVISGDPCVGCAGLGWWILYGNTSEGQQIDEGCCKSVSILLIKDLSCSYSLKNFPPSSQLCPPAIAHVVQETPVSLFERCLLWYGGSKWREMTIYWLHSTLTFHNPSHCIFHFILFSVLETLGVHFWDPTLQFIRVKKCIVNRNGYSSISPHVFMWCLVSDSAVLKISTIMSKLVRKKIPLKIISKKEKLQIHSNWWSSELSYFSHLHALYFIVSSLCCLVASRLTFLCFTAQ